MAYRQSRNIEASIIEYLTTQLATDSWVVTVEKTFSKIYKINLPSICVRVGDTLHDRIEIGSTSTKRTATVLIDLFCQDDGQRLDLKDYLQSILKSGLVYYEYIIVNRVVDSKTANGRISVLEIIDTPINSDVDRDDLDIHDRFRHLLSLQINLSTVEV